MKQRKDEKGNVNQKLRMLKFKAILLIQVHLSMETNVIEGKRARTKSSKGIHITSKNIQIKIELL